MKMTAYIKELATQAQKQAMRIAHIIRTLRIKTVHSIVTIPVYNRILMYHRIKI